MISDIEEQRFNMASTVNDSELPPPTILEQIAHELLTTERTYVNDLENVIIKGYMNDLLGKRQELSISSGDVREVFGPIEEVYQVNKDLCKRLAACSMQLERMAECLVEYSDSFTVYADYCQMLPRMQSKLQDLTQRPSVQTVLESRRRELKNQLHLDAYLSTPFQRILRYHLFLKRAVDSMEKSGSDATDVRLALDCMRKCAEHVNAVKKRSDMALRTQQISKLLIGYDDAKKQGKLQYAELTEYGELLMECHVQQKSKGGFFTNVEVGRQLFLFEKLLMITKERSETKWLVIKAMIPFSQMAIYPNIPSDPLAFRVIPNDDVRRFFTFKAKTAAEKQECCRILIDGMLNHCKIALLVPEIRTPKRSGRKLSRRSRSIGAAADRTSPGITGSPANNHLPRKLSSALADNRFQPTTNRLLGRGLKRQQRVLRHFSTAATAPLRITTSGQVSPETDSGIEDATTTAKETEVTNEKPTATHHHSERHFHQLYSELNVTTTPQRTTSTPLPSHYFGVAQNSSKPIPTDNDAAGEKSLDVPLKSDRKETAKKSADAAKLDRLLSRRYVERTKTPRTPVAAYVEKGDRTTGTAMQQMIRNKVKDRVPTPGAVKTRILRGENVSDVASSSGAKESRRLEQLCSSTPTRVGGWTAASESELFFNSDQRHSQPTTQCWQQTGDIKRAVNDWERRMSSDEDGQKVTSPTIAAAATSPGCVQNIVRQWEDDHSATPS